MKTTENRRIKFVLGPKTSSLIFFFPWLLSDQRSLISLEIIPSIEQVDFVYHYCCYKSAYYDVLATKGKITCADCRSNRWAAICSSNDAKTRNRLQETKGKSTKY